MEKIAKAFALTLGWISVVILWLGIGIIVVTFISGGCTAVSNIGG